MKDYESFLLDYDGCLGKTLDPWIKAIKAVSASYKLRLSDVQITHQLQDLRNAGLHGLPKNKIMEYKQTVESMASAEAKKAPLYEHAMELIKTLKQANKKLAIVSSNTSGLELQLRSNDILSYFDAVVTGNHVKEKKPHPEGIILALKLIRGEKSTSVMIGDSSSDILAAHRAGIDSILFHTEGHSRFHNVKELMRSKPTMVISNHSELSRAVKSRNKLAQALYIS